MAGYNQEYVDLLGPEAETRLRDYIKLAGELEKQILDINEAGKKIGTGSGLGSAVNSQGQLVDLKKQIDETLALKKKAASDEKELNKLIADEERARKKKYADEERELNKLIAAEQKVLDANSRAERKAALNERKQADKDYQASWKALLSERDKAEAASAAKRKKDAAAAVSSVAADSNIALSKTLETLRLGYNKLTAAERENENIGGVLQNRIQQLDTQLKSSDAGLGKYTRNVGNYKGATEGLGRANANFSRSLGQISGELTNLAYGAKTFFSSLSNNLGPAILEFGNLKNAVKEAAAENLANAVAAGATAKATAIAGGAAEEAASQVGEMAKEQALAASEAVKGQGIFAALGKSLFSFQTVVGLGIAAVTIFAPIIIDWVGSLFKAKDGIDKVEESLKTLNKALEGAEYQKAVSDVQELTTNIGLAKEGFLDKEKVLSQYNETIGITTGEVNNLDDAEAALVKNGDAYIKMMLYKAAANLALQEATKKAYEAEQTRIKPSKEFATMDEKFQEALSPEDANDEGLLFSRARKRKEEREKRRKALIDEAGRDQQVQEDIANTFQKRAAQIARDSNFDFFGGKNGAEAEAKSAAALAERERKREAAAQARADKAQSIKDAKAQKADDKEISDLYKKNQLIAETEAISAKAIADNEENSLEDRLAANDVFIQKSIEAAGFRVQDEVNAEEEFQKALTELTLEGAKRRKQITDKESADATKSAIGLSEGYGTKQGYDKLDQIDKDKAAYRYKLAKEIVDISNRAIQSGSDAARQRIDQLDQEIAKINEKKDAEIEAIKASGLSQAEQKEKIAAVNAKAASAEFALNEKKRQQQIKAAKFEKAANISSIIQATALAIIKVARDFPGPVGIGLAVAIGAIGALQLSRAIQAPIPQYRLGVGQNGGAAHPGGMAIIGDGGRVEVVDEGGRLSLSPAKATAVNLARGAIVYPSVEDYISKAQGMSMRGAGIMRHYDERQSISTAETEKLLRRVANGVEKLTHKEAVNIIGSGWNDYIKDIFN